VSALQRRTPKAEARAESQRERILDAAQKCFIEQGFHGAGMALIAETAGISTGLTYRYFASKSAIMLAIIARELEGKRARIGELCGGEDFLAAVLEKFRAWQTGSADVMNAALFLEMSAEASRSPEILEAIRESDALVLGEFEGWLRRDRSAGGLGMPAGEASPRALLMQCLIEGLVVRAARDPGLDAAAVSRALAPVFAQLGFTAPGKTAP
jgi:AcrR family transcriptional regulator